MKILKHPPFKSHFFFGLLLAIVLLFLFPACSGPKIVEVRLEGEPEMNQEQSCMIYIYQLSSETEFMTVTSKTFWSKGNAFEGLIGKPIAKQLFPGDSEPVPLNISKETRFIGAAADFYKPKPGSWRQIFRIDSKAPKLIKVFIKKDSIEIIE